MIRVITVRATRPVFAARKIGRAGDVHGAEGRIRHALAVEATISKTRDVARETGGTAFAPAHVSGTVTVGALERPICRARNLLVGGDGSDLNGNDKKGCA